MNLMSGHLRPGEVLEVSGPEGQIKAAVPGLFSKEDLENLPLITAWPQGSKNSFSMPEIGDEVWVLFFGDNPEQLYWMLKCDPVRENTKHAKTKNADGTRTPIQEKQGAEIVANIENGGTYATIYHNDDEGWMFKNKDAVIQIDQKGNVKTTNGMKDGTISITEDGIVIGAEEKTEHPVPHGDKVADLFEKMFSLFRKISEVCSEHPYTAAISAMIDAEMPKFEDDANYINSENITIS